MIYYKRRAELMVRKMQDVLRDLRMVILEDDEREAQQLTSDLKEYVKELEELI